MQHAADGADRARWPHTLAMLAQVYNSSRPSGAPAINPLEYCPLFDANQFEARPAPPPTAEQERILQQYFNGKPKRGL